MGLTLAIYRYPANRWSRRNFGVRTRSGGPESTQSRSRGAEIKIFGIGTTLRYRVQAIESLDLHPFEVSGII
jgi:hypothetical protein